MSKLVLLRKPNLSFTPFFAAPPERHCAQRNEMKNKTKRNEKRKRKVENASNSAVATDVPICSRIGLDVLRDGGNAADAAIASALCLGTTNPASSGLGGGGFILVHFDRRRTSMARVEDDRRGRARRTHSTNGAHDGEAPYDDDDVPFVDERAQRDDYQDDDDDDDDDDDGREGRVVEFIDCRETAPRNASPGMFDSLPANASTFGGMSIAVPGELRGLELLHRRHGSLPWSRLVRPSYELARDGVMVGRYLASAIERNWMHVRETTGLARMLSRGGDGTTPLAEGDVMVRDRYAETLRAIMVGGADALYRGELAESLARVSSRVGRVARLSSNVVFCFHRLIVTTATKGCSGRRRHHYVGGYNELPPRVGESYTSFDSRIMFRAMRFSLPSLGAPS